MRLPLLATQLRSIPFTGVVVAEPVLLVGVLLVGVQLDVVVVGVRLDVVVGEVRLDVEVVAVRLDVVVGVLRSRSGTLGSLSSMSWNPTPPPWVKLCRLRADARLLSDM